MTEVCQRCKEEGEDRRTLWMACLYDMNELHVPFDEKEVIAIINDKRIFYTLRVCKDCRADWMAAIKDWFNSTPSNKSCGSGIYVRINGATKEVSEYEFKMMYPDKEPVRVIK